MHCSRLVHHKDSSSSLSFWLWPNEQSFTHQLCGDLYNSCLRRSVGHPRNTRKTYRKVLTKQSTFLQPIQVLLFCPTILTSSRKSITREKEFGTLKILNFCINPLRIFSVKITENIGQTAFFNNLDQIIKSMERIQRS